MYAYSIVGSTTMTNLPHPDLMGEISNSSVWEVNNYAIWHRILHSIIRATK
jgi:hypothetical protein